MKINSKTIAFVKESERADEVLLETLVSVSDWGVTDIKSRGKNLLGLIWDRIAPWLDLPKS